MKNGFIKIASACPSLRIADTRTNTDELIRLAEESVKGGASITVFPELCITGASCGDLFLNGTLIASAKAELARYLEKTKKLNLLSFVGLPMAIGGKLRNCAAVCLNGKLLGLIPKEQLTPAEQRCFAGGFVDVCEFLLNGESIPCGSRLLFEAEELPELVLAAEIGESLDALLPSSVFHCMAGATVICNPTASEETVDKLQRRRDAVKALSRRLHCAYLYTSAGSGETTTDSVMGGHRLVAENGALLAEALPLSEDTSLLFTEIDVELLACEQRKDPAFNGDRDGYQTLYFSLPIKETALTRFVDPNPFIPTDPAELTGRCETILQIQTEGLRRRMERAYAKKAVLGISGGLDSTLALIVAARAMDAMKRPRTDIVAVTMPCFGTTKRTKNNATVLCEELGVDFRCVNIAASVEQHFKDIGHDPAICDVTYENCQARERTQVLMDIANDCGGMVIGTGDLSELALGWATYNGDHMSMYGVNGDVPKTLIRHIVAHSADTADLNGQPALAAALRDVLDTPVSPELLPADQNGDIAQKTEDLVGPYEIHDFYIYHLLRHGYSPEKLYRLAKRGLGDRYDDATLLKWLETLLRRFFAQQFKRSCLPDGPKVGSVGLSPRGGWCMPSDASSALWLSQVEELKKHIK